MFDLSSFKDVDSLNESKNRASYKLFRAAFLNRLDLKIQFVYPKVTPSKDILFIKKQQILPNETLTLGTVCPLYV